MKKYGQTVVKHRELILLVALILLVPAVIGMAHTRINYDMLEYLPDSMDTVKGQDILMDDFGKGAFSTIIIDGMDTKDVAKLKQKIEKIDHVESVVWYDNLSDITMPMEFLPDDVYDAFNEGDSTVMAVFFDTSTSADETLDAVSEIRSTVGKKCFVTGMSAMVTDLKNLCEKEEPVYVGIAVLFSTIAMMILMDSYLIPIIFLLSIGMAILWNLGSNVFLGEISYITKALSAVLQLGVTMDYSIFLWHSYEEQKYYHPDDNDTAMAEAVNATLTSVVGSSITTVAGFIALCFMTYTLGRDLGIVMAKGVVLGVIGCVTTLPSLILLFDKYIEKTRHKSILPDMGKFAKAITKKPAIFIAIFLIVIVPAFIGYKGTDLYYDLGEALPKDMAYVVANEKLTDEFGMASTHMALIDSDMSQKDVGEMMEEIDQVKGVKATLGLSSVVGPMVPDAILPDAARELVKSNNYELLMISSEYKVASDEVNDQIVAINDIIKKYDHNGMLIGEAPCTKDLIDVTNHDFNVVNTISILAIFVIIGIVFKSALLPIVLVAVIEFAIMINLGIPYYMGTSLPFIAPICISTIQLGATVDYAILMTTRYKQERINGNEKRRAINIATATAIPSIIVSATAFFAATFGVALYSDLDIIGAFCTLLARGAVISMLAVMFILPSMLMLFDKAICFATKGMHEAREKNACETTEIGGNV